MDRLRLSELDFNPFSALPLEFPDCFIHELRNFRRYSFAPSSFGIASDSLDNGGCQVRIRTNFSQCRTELILRQCSLILGALKRPGIELDTGERLIELMRNQAGNLSDHRRSLHFHEAPVRFLCLVETLTLSFK